MADADQEREIPPEDDPRLELLKGVLEDQAAEIKNGQFLLEEKEKKISSLKIRLTVSTMLNLCIVGLVAIFMPFCSFKSSDYVERMEQQARFHGIFTDHMKVTCDFLKGRKDVSAQVRETCRSYAFESTAPVQIEESANVQPQPSGEQTSPKLKFINDEMFKRPSPEAVTDSTIDEEAEEDEEEGEAPDEAEEEAEPADEAEESEEIPPPVSTP